MRRLATLLLLAVAIVAGYTYWRVERLERDVEELKAVVARRSAPKPAAEGQNVRRLIAQAGEICGRAKAYLESGNSKKAKRELGLCLKKLSEASEAAKKASENKELRKAWADVKNQVDKLWKQFAEESKRKKGS